MHCPPSARPHLPHRRGRHYRQTSLKYIDPPNNDRSPFVPSIDDLTFGKDKIMSYTREPIRMSGVLRGNSQSAKCMVSAVRVTLDGTRLFKDCKYSVEWLSAPLPEGDYNLSFCGKIIGMRLSKEGWRTIPELIRPDSKRVVGNRLSH